MSLAPGTRLGSYEVRALLGAGGMGEVYRARDTRLNRDVALKALPASFSHDAERVARFRREAHLLASLNHPHIGAIYGLEEVEGRQLLVLELVEGGTLADRILQGPLPVSESLAIAQQIAEALEAAHERGIVHRDLKPANVALTADDRVKVLDFGLAKSTGADHSSSDLGDSPTLTIGATQTGVILGTAAYMAPEQAKGRAADQRSDVWAFGCVLFEMLTGHRAFAGEDTSDILAAVLRAEPDWGLLPPDASDAIRVLVKRCLVKDRHTRIANLGVARFVMSEATARPAEPRIAAPAQTAPPVNGRRSFRLLPVALGGVVVGAALAVAAGRFGLTSTPASPRTGARFSIVPPPDSSMSLALQGQDRVVAISPDGRTLAYRGGNVDGQTQLFVRELNELEARPLAGTSGGREPFFSPDGRWIGYFATSALMKIPTVGGTPVVICPIAGGAGPAGASWGDDDAIVFALRQRGVLASVGGLQRVTASGGEVTVLTLPNIDKGELSQSMPSLLPGSAAVLFTSAGNLASNGAVGSNIVLLDLETSRQTLLVEGGLNPIYLDSGHIVYVSPAGALQVVRFDPRRRVVEGRPVPLPEQVMLPSLGEAQVVVSRSGTLAFVPPTEASKTAEQRTMVWVDRQGREEPLDAPPHGYAIPRISPDGSRVALDARDQSTDIWIWDLGRRSLVRLTNDASLDMMPIWTPDGRRIIWSTSRSSPNPNVHWQSADGTGKAERLSESPFAQFPTTVTPDGKQLIFSDAPQQTEVALHRLALQGDHTRSPLLQTQDAASGLAVRSSSNGELSPDGRWLAYESNESGQFEVYVRPFPDVEAGRYQISTSGGTRPVWARSGAELFYLDDKDVLTSVAVQIAGDTFRFGAPSTILQRAFYPGFSARGFNLRGYDVSPDGKRFLMLKPSGTLDAMNDAPTITVVLNWFDELEARLSKNVP